MGFTVDVKETYRPTKDDRILWSGVLSFSEDGSHLFDIEATLRAGEKNDSPWVAWPTREFDIAGEKRYKVVFRPEPDISLAAREAITRHLEGD